jgi:penicillin V acylase-like amidase (Ntn superfamily)
MLDNFATVEEAVAYIDEDTFQVVSDMMPDGSRLATLHLSISDATGDCAIFEYVGGKLTVYHSKEYKVMTNSLTYNKQLALSEYWKSIGGLSFLPGTNRAADRFARASFYINALPETDDEKIAVASVFSVVRNASVPYGISTPESPEISTTQWRTVSESKNLRYFFESSLTPNTFWVNLQDFDLSEGAPVFKLSIANGEMYHGNTAKNFKTALPFKFMGVKG